MSMLAAARVVLEVVFSSIAFVGVVSNASVILVLLYKRRKGDKMRFWLLNMAVANMLLSLLGPPTFILSLRKKLGDWPLGKALCFVLLAGSPVLHFYSALCLTFIAIDRYLHIKKFESNQGPMSRLRQLGVVVLCFLLAAALSAHYNVNINYIQRNIGNRTQWQCWNGLQQKTSTMVYMVVRLLAGCMLPLLVMVGCYARVLSFLKKGEELLGGAARCRSHRRTWNMCAAMIIGFAVCEAPYYTFVVIKYSMNPVKNGPLAKTMPLIEFSLAALSMSCCCLNYFIYCRMYQPFQTFMKSIRRKWGSSFQSSGKTLLRTSTLGDRTETHVL